MRSLTKFYRKHNQRQWLLPISGTKFGLQEKKRSAYHIFRHKFQILDFSDNKLQELHADTLASYSSIKFLYLADNHIYLIDDDALSAFTELQTLDLANNVILELPSSIFQLPSLRKLYLRGNPILHKTINSLDLVKPIKAPLELLDLSDCKIKELPDLGYLPQLQFYNISHNPLTALNTYHFAAMCNLVKVDLTDSIGNMKLCSLRATILWFQEKRVFFQLDDYSRLNTRGSYWTLFSSKNMKMKFKIL